MYVAVNLNQPSMVYRIRLADLRIGGFQQLQTVNNVGQGRPVLVATWEWLLFASLESNVEVMPTHACVFKKSACFKKKIAKGL